MHAVIQLLSFFSFSGDILTCHSRVNAGRIDRINYVLFTPSQAGKKATMKATATLACVKGAGSEFALHLWLPDNVMLKQLLWRRHAQLLSQGALRWKFKGAAGVRRTNADRTKSQLNHRCSTLSQSLTWNLSGPHQWLNKHKKGFFFKNPTLLNPSISHFKFLFHSHLFCYLLVV